MKIKPLKRRCANNFCNRNAKIGENLCAKHVEEAAKARRRKFIERKSLELIRKEHAARLVLN